MISGIIIHCTHYQHCDWPRTPAYFENLRNFVDKHDYSIIMIICYPIISADYTALSAYKTIIGRGFCDIWNNQGLGKCKQSNYCVKCK